MSFFNVLGLITLIISIILIFLIKEIKTEKWSSRIIISLVTLIIFLQVDIPINIEYAQFLIPASLIVVIIFNIGMFLKYGKETTKKLLKNNDLLIWIFILVIISKILLSL